MLKILLIWLFALVGTPDHFSSTTRYNCYEYDFVEDVGVFSRTNEMCYVSPLTITKRKHVLTVSTDSLTVRFAVLRKFPLATSRNGENKGAYTGSQTFAIILGQPDQLYIIREEIKIEENHEKQIRYYVFSLRPINQNGRTNRRIEGRVLEASTHEICKM